MILFSDPAPRPARKRAPTPLPSSLRLLPPPPPLTVERLPPSGAAGEVIVEQINNFVSPELHNRRALAVFLPPAYDASPQIRYKVLYLNDGQDAPALKVKQTLETLYAGGRLEPLVVVAVHTTADRLNEYGVAGIPDYKGRGARAAGYTALLLETVMPYIALRHRTLAGPQNTAILGASLGGLSAFDIAWNHPQVFGAVGVFSGSFWWRSDSSSVQAQQDSRIMQRVVRQSAGRPALRMWFQAGTLDESEDRDGNGVIDAIQDTTELMDELAAKGYRAGKDMVYLQVEGGEHNPATWARALPQFLTWAFPAGC